jgi:hypothetical protein
MSRVYVVCEGPTDVALLTAVVAAIDPDRVPPVMIQPERSKGVGDCGPHGGGWKGVKSWCEATREHGGLEAVGLLQGEDVLVVHVDADIALDADVNCARPCPPAKDTCDALRGKILSEWLGLVAPVPRLVFFVPSKATEAWVLAALYPHELPQGQSHECICDPATRLIGKPEKLVRWKRDGNNRRLHKPPAAWTDQVPRLQAAWAAVVESTPEAARLDSELRSVLT